MWIYVLLISEFKNIFEKFHGEKQPEKFANLDLDFGIDTPLDRWDTSLEDWGNTMGNKWGPWLGEKIGNMVNRKHRVANFDIDFGADKPLDRWDTYLEDRFENWDLLHAEKNEYSQ